MLYSSRPVSNFFSLFSLPEEFNISRETLDSTYRSLQRQAHPDLHAMATAHQQEEAAEHSALINRAYATLKSPLERAKYVLQLNGCGESHGGEATTNDPELLLSVLEARELVEEIGDPEQLHHMQADNLKKQEECIQALTSAFQRRDWSKAMELTTQLRYATRIGEAISQKS